MLQFLPAIQKLPNNNETELFLCLGVGSVWRKKPKIKNIVIEPHQRQLSQ